MITICVWLASNKPGDEDECKDKDNGDDEEDGNENETDQSVIKWNSRQDKTRYTITDRGSTAQSSIRLARTPDSTGKTSIKDK